MRFTRLSVSWIVAGLLGSTTTLAGAVEPDKTPDEPVLLRAWGVRHDSGGSVWAVFNSKREEMFRKKFPHINAVHPGGLHFGGNEYNIMFDVLPLMQIAGGAQPDVLNVLARKCHSYVTQRFLYPLDKHLEKALGIEMGQGHLLDLDGYLQRIKESPLYESHLAPRIRPQLWTAIRRECPYGLQCSYCRRYGLKAAEKHYHIWTMPIEVNATVLVYRRDMFRNAGLPDRAPDTLDELIDFARRMTDPDEGRFGLRIDLQEIGRTAQIVLGSLGGRVAEQDEDGAWRCAYDSEAAVEACYFVSRLFYEPYINPRGVKLTSVVFPGASPGSVDTPPWRGGIATIGMFSEVYRQQWFYDYRSPSQYGLGAIPKGPGSMRGGVMGVNLLGIFAGLEGDQDKIDAAWEWIWFYDGLESRRAFARTYVEHGKAQYVHPKLLIDTGFATYAKLVPKQWVNAIDEALRTSSAPLIGENAEMIYKKSFCNAVDQMWTSSDVQRAVAEGNEVLAKQLIRDILKQRVRLTNEQILGILTPAQKKFRSRLAVITAVAIFVIFVLVFRRVIRTFVASQQLVEVNRRGGMWQFGRYKWAYILLIPAVCSVALWAYYPLARGTTMAFQDYKIRGASQWVGLENFTTVLFSEEFWYALWVSFKYVMMYALLGFTAPIALAFLLTEIPKGKVLFRTLYYLPAVLSGIVVMFLWKGFYGQYGMINQVINFFIALLNMIPSVAIEEIHKAWLQDPNFALFFVLLPVIWVGAGPGCLIYLAALKTIPEELYEAADIDGAGILHKVFHVSIPGIKGLIMINFIGVMVAQMKGGSEFVLAMTQGGPHTPYGATEVVGLHIYWQAFGFLKFGIATAMAWVLGSMLVGFTVLQMQRLSRMEFRTAAGIK